MSEYHIDKGIAGGQADMVPATIISGLAEATIEAGQPVQRGSATDDGVDVATSGTFVGIAMGNATQSEYAKGDQLRVGTAGTFWVQVSAKVDAGDTVSYAAANGKWGKAEGSGNNIVDGAAYVTGAKKDGLAKVRIPVNTTTAGA